MSTSTATPPVPPRPTRVQAAAAAEASKLPEIPPRPANKRLDRSVSPGNNYPRSPLYEVPPSSSLYRPKTNEPSLTPLARVPSVQNLPLVGQEGDEYANIQYAPAQPTSALGADAAEQTRRIGEDLKLHAPKPSLSQAGAKAQVQAVTRTDPNQAASHGFGKSSTPSHDDYDHLQQLRSKSSFSRPGSTASGERRTSTYAEDHGPAETGGMRVPINPLLGDVQAPSPAQFSLTPTHTGGAERPRKHHRTKSGREVFLPPGSYGLHGHGVVPQDRFEQDWYQKHPEQLQNEEKFGHGVYESIGSGRGNFALSSDDLNKIVRNTASRGSGFGTNVNTMSYPDEQIGYLASEQYSSQPPNYLSKMHSNSSQPAVESPLRKTSLPHDDSGRDDFKAAGKASSHENSDHGVEDEEDTLHVDDPARRYNKITGGEETIHETHPARPSLLHRTSDGGLVDEHGYSVPILASDEVAKHGGEFMQPAISPKQERRSSLYDQEFRSGDVTPSSRPSSRPGSIHGMQGVNHSLSRFSTHHDDRDSMHTPLEDVAEYEPLFPDEDGNQRPMSHAERFKQRPDYKHRFPSQDIWEDTPDSSMHVATVSTPDLPSQMDQSKQLGSGLTIEPPSTETARKEEVGEEEKKFVPKEERFEKSQFAPHLHDDMPIRPGMKPRFPSQDVWEDSPDSQHLVTTVGGPQMEEETSPVDARPSIPPRPLGKSRLGEAASSAQVAPSIPARPVKMNEVPSDSKLSDLSMPPSAESGSKEISPTDRKAPIIPDRPKPQVPARPQKKTSGDSLSKTISAGSIETEKAILSPPLGKVKPQIPARPTNKISSLKGNFMNDLNQKLGLGPPKEKETEPEVEQEIKPLEDARKARARGPQRRAPAKSPSASAESTAVKSTFGLSKPASLWHIHPDDGLVMVLSRSGSREATAAESKPGLSEEKVQQMDHATIADTPCSPIIGTTETADAPRATALSTNIAGEPTDPDARPPAPTQEKSDPMIHIAEPLEGETLSQKSTESSEAKSGHTLTRKEPNPSTDAIPLDQHTTAETTGIGATLEKVETHSILVNQKAKEEKKVIRDEQVTSSAPGPEAPTQETSSSLAGADAEEAAGAKQTVEPMDEGDVSYGRLEEMTAKADGKGHAEEEGETMKKVVE